MLRFKIFAIFLLLNCIFSFDAISQPRNSKRFSAIESEKIAYITKELKLTPSEAQKFFPLYNEYNTNMWDVKTAKRSITQQPEQRINSLNSTQGTQKDLIAYDAKEVELKRNYRKKFSQVIGEARASQFFEVEQRFRESLIRELQSRRQK